LWVVLAAAGCSIGAVVLLTRRAAWFPGLPAPLLWLALGAFPVLLLSAFLSNLLQAVQDFVQFNRVALSAPVFKLVVAVVAVGLLHQGVIGALVAVIVGSVGGLWIAYLGLRPHLRSSRAGAVEGYARKCVGYGWRAHLSNILAFLNYRADIFLLNLFLAPAAVGVYAVAVQIAERLWILSQATSTVLLPRLASLYDQEDQRNNLTPIIARWVFLLSLVGGLVLALLCVPLVRVLFGDRYAGAATALLWLLPGVIVGSVSRILSNDIAARGRPEINMYIAVVVVAVNIGLNVLLIPRMGIVGASISTTVAYGLNTVMKIAVYARMSGNRWLRVVLIPSTELIAVRRSAAGLLRAGRMPL
jgi:O-antigen/teichoic acid export membrane protein